ncbi:MAG: AGE family epimerase/isomerase [Acidobacteria bacterium]|nr:AGE family epimerase/isomerase [Acidobacteriota bacterium]
MPTRNQIQDVLERTRSYLVDSLLPFWMEKSPDPEYGGFLSYFDRNGKATGETTKPFLMQIRMLFAMSASHRAGYGKGRCAELARDAADFIINRYWDPENEGWYWIADRQGNPTYKDKVGYGHCFGIYAFSEYFLATGDPRGREYAEKTYTAVCKHMADTRHGGFLELMYPDWQPARPGLYGGDRKSLDVHMHMLEALTTFYEMSRHPTHRRRLLEIIDLILTRMLRPDGTGYIQFTMDFQPLPAILFAVSWGRDAKPADGIARPINMTSPGHNVEFAWLLLHAADILGIPRREYAELVRKIMDHCIRIGIDQEYGGVYADTPADAPATQYEKQFWQQAEVLIGMLDAYAMFGEEKYWDAFRNVHDFVFTKMINWKAGGEWFERLDREGRPIDDALGHAWKICYHTVRSMIETVRRLERLL